MAEPYQAAVAGLTARLRGAIIQNPEPYQPAEVGDALDLDVRVQGRAPSSANAVQLRELTPADLALLDQPRGSQAPTIKRLKDSHHGLARALAGGMKPAEASAITGYSLSRISILQADPTFQELLAHYRNNAEAEFKDLHARMASLSMDFANELQYRIDEQPDSFENKELTDAIKVLADRTGHAPVTRQISSVNYRVDISARIAQARQRAGLIDASATDVEPADG